LAMALSGSFDVLLIDWMLPKLTGIEVCKAFRKEDSSTPVIFLTARDTVQDTITGLQTGANDYIKKPFHFEELLERIRVQLRHSNGGSNLLLLGPFTLNEETHQVFRGKEEIILTQKEFALLEFLMRHKGKVCKRNRILDAVWGAAADHDSGVIDVYINALRKKLKLQKEDEFIQTIRGVGYIAKD